MPDQSVRAMPSTPVPALAGRLWRRAWLRTLAVMLAVVLVLTGVEVGVRVLPTDAVQVRAIAPESGHTLATATVTDGQTVAQLYVLVNSMHSEPAYGIQCSGGLPGPVIFDVVFIRWDLPIEDAAQIASGCGWFVSQGAILTFRTDTAGQSQAILSELHALLPTDGFNTAVDGHDAAAWSTAPGTLPTGQVGTARS